MELLLERAPLADYSHPQFATPLHLACLNGDGASTRKLLEHGADATLTDARGATPLSVALRYIGHSKSKAESPLAAILDLAQNLCLIDFDLVAAAGIRGYSRESIFAKLLSLDEDTMVSEQVICIILKLPSAKPDDVHLAMQRNGGIGVTVYMLKAARDYESLEVLLKSEFGPVCNVTPDVLQKHDRRSMCLLLDHDPKVHINEKVVIHALESHDDRGQASIGSEQILLEELFERSPLVAVTHDMLKAARSAADMQILLKHLEPGTRISDDVVQAESRLDPAEAVQMVRLLLQFDQNIRLGPEVGALIVGCEDPLDALATLLARDPALPVTSEMFLEVFGLFQSAVDERTREQLADLMERCGKRLAFTEEVVYAIDDAYQGASDAEKKKRLYSLRATDK